MSVVIVSRQVEQTRHVLYKSLQDKPTKRTIRRPIQSSFAAPSERLHCILNVAYEYKPCMLRIPAFRRFYWKIDCLETLDCVGVLLYKHCLALHALCAYTCAQLASYVVSESGRIRR